MKRIVNKPIKAETDAEMTARHYQEERVLLQTIQRQTRELVDNIEMLHDAAYETMELGALYEGALDVLQDWPSNFSRLNSEMIKYNGLGE